MDGSRFDALARTLAGPRTRRGVLAGLGGLIAGAAGLLDASAACGPDQVNRRGLGCVCRATGRPPGGAGCPCPAGQKRCGAASPCVLQAGCCADADCPTGQCLGCDLGSGTCQTTCIAPATCGGGGTPGQCGCTPDCTDKVCGDTNGCGGFCTFCPSQRFCLENGSCAFPCQNGNDCAGLGGCDGCTFSLNGGFCADFDMGENCTSTADCPAGSVCQPPDCPAGSVCQDPAFCRTLC